MGFDHERLDVYQTALDFLEFTDSLIAGLPRGRASLSDQLSRASLSILANVAEGAGKTSPAQALPLHHLTGLCHRSGCVAGCLL